MCPAFQRIDAEEYFVVEIISPNKEENKCLNMVPWNALELSKARSISVYRSCTLFDFVNFNVKCIIFTAPPHGLGFPPVQHIDSPISCFQATSQHPLHVELSHGAEVGIQQSTWIWAAPSRQNAPNYRDNSIDAGDEVYRIRAPGKPKQKHQIKLDLLTNYTIILQEFFIDEPEWNYSMLQLTCDYTDCLYTSFIPDAGCGYLCGYK